MSYDSHYSRVLRYSAEKATTEPQEEEYQQLSLGVRANPKDRTGHLAAADWAADNGYLKEEDFRRKTAEWLEREADDHYSGGGAGSYKELYDPSGEVPSYLRGFAYPYTVHKNNLPEWARDHVVKKAHYWGGKPADPSSAVAPSGVNFHWPTYKDMENALRAAHSEHYDKQQAEAAK